MVIVTNIKMTRDKLMKVSELAHDGIARTIFPIHTNYDDDIIFSVSTLGKNRINSNMERIYLVNYIGICVSNLLIEAINYSVKYADCIIYFSSYIK